MFPSFLAEKAAASPEANFSAILFIDISLLALLVVVAVVMVRVSRLFAVVMLSGIYSLLSAAFFVSMDAVDVAFTEAAVGAGISTVLMLSGMLLTAKREKPISSGRAPMALFICLIVGAALVYATIDAPAFGDPHSPVNSYVGTAYIAESQENIDVPNIVTAVLASYRGFDTLGETLVVFTAGVSVMLLLGVGSMRGGRSVRDLPPELDPANPVSHTSLKNDPPEGAR